jgi:hypothetical protein
MGIKNNLFTGCPTTWGISRTNVNRTNKNNDTCLLTLTDYKRDISVDENLINIVFNYFKKITFFPQGEFDIEYLNSLKIYKNNKSKFNLLNHELNEYYNYVNNEPITFIGTRLHGGIYCLKKNKDTLIIPVDNRAKDISASMNLPIINGRGNFIDITNWIEGKNIFSELKLPFENISKWKTQFL